MAEDSYSESSHTGWLSRIGKSITGILVGGIMFVVAFPILWWNEGRSVLTAKGLAEGAKITIEVSPERVDRAHEGQLVHTIGRAEGKDTVSDEAFGVSAPGLIKLRRDVELFQWIESKSERTEKRFGGGEETVTHYSYSTGWDDEVHASSNFKRPEGHLNPTPAYRAEDFSTRDAVLGAFRLPALLISAWNDFEPHRLPDIEKLPEARRAQAAVRDGWLYVNGNPDTPKVGDARVRFASIPAGEASVLARQVADTFEAYVTSFGTTIARIASGAQSKEAMFAAAESENTLVTWLLRGGGFLLMFIGLALVLAPLRVLADVVPFIGNLVGVGTGFAAFLLSVICSMGTMATAWLWYRPALAIAIALVAAAAGYFLVKAFSKAKATA
ncbi:MAG: TMEM43 family protein [Roseimicrobium sp.]